MKNTIGKMSQVLSTMAGALNARRRRKRALDIIAAGPPLTPAVAGDPGLEPGVEAASASGWLPLGRSRGEEGPSSHPPLVQRSPRSACLDGFGSSVAVRIPLPGASSVAEELETIMGEIEDLSSTGETSARRIPRQAKLS